MLVACSRVVCLFFFFSSRRRHTRWPRDWSSDVCSSDLLWFEYDEQGRPLRPESYRSLCMASVNTHDLPPTAGYLAGDHVTLRHQLGLLERPLAEEHEADARSEEHTSELQSRGHLVCRLLLEKKKKKRARQQESSTS